MKIPCYHDNHNQAPLKVLHKSCTYLAWFLHHNLHVSYIPILLARQRSKNLAETCKIVATFRALCKIFLRIMIVNIDVNHPARACKVFLYGIYSPSVFIIAACKMLADKTCKLIAQITDLVDLHTFRHSAQTCYLALCLYVVEDSCKAIAIMLFS